MTVPFTPAELLVIEHRVPDAIPDADLSVAAIIDTSAETEIETRYIVRGADGQLSASGRWRMPLSTAARIADAIQPLLDEAAPRIAAAREPDQGFLYARREGREIGGTQVRVAVAHFQEPLFLLQRGPVGRAVTTVALPVGRAPEFRTALSRAVAEAARATASASPTHLVS